MNFRVAQLFVYPIKALGGIALKEAQLVNSGIAYDRQWMLVDENNRFITQREIPELALFEVQLLANSLRVRYGRQSILIPKCLPDDRRLVHTRIWKNKVTALREAPLINEWFSDLLGQDVCLVRKASQDDRHVDQHPDAPINFPDSNQFLIIGQSALDQLNRKLPNPIRINRFRPNLVFTGGEPHVEDGWRSLRIGATRLEWIKACARCKVTTVDQETGEVGPEPLLTLSKYRRWDRNIWFGQYFKLAERGEGMISVGQELVADTVE